MCPDGASLWTKLHNEPYLRTHPKMLVGYLFYSTVTQYIGFMAVILVGMYITTSIFGAVWVLAG